MPIKMPPKSQTWPEVITNLKFTPPTPEYPPIKKPVTHPCIKPMTVWGHEERSKSSSRAVAQKPFQVSISTTIALELARQILLETVPGLDLPVSVIGDMITMAMKTVESEEVRPLHRVDAACTVAGLEMLKSLLEQGQ